MDNFFLARLFDWDHRYLGRWLPRAQFLIKKVGLSWQIRRPMDPSTEMTNIEQRVNLWHMAV
jgi:O-methyltransferase